MTADLARPVLITSIGIRKMLAATLQLLDVNEAELKCMINHLSYTSMYTYNGTAKKVEDRISAMEVTKVAIVLMTKDDGVDFDKKKVGYLDEHVTGNKRTVNMRLKSPQGTRKDNCKNLSSKLLHSPHT